MLRNSVLVTGDVGYTGSLVSAGGQNRPGLGR